MIAAPKDTQSASDRDTSIHVEQPPKFPGDVSQFLTEHMVLPKAAMENEWGGKVIIKFVIDGSGDVTNIEVKKSSGYKELDMVALRAISQMPRWTPATRDGVPVSVPLTMPISFDIRNYSFGAHQ